MISVILLICASYIGFQISYEHGMIVSFASIVYAIESLSRHVKLVKILEIIKNKDV